MKTGIKVFVVGLFMLLAGQAQAAVDTGYVIDNILHSDSSFLSDVSTTSQFGLPALTGYYDFTYLGSEAGNTNILFELVYGDSTPIFMNKGENETVVSTTVKNIDIGGLALKDKNYPSTTYAINRWTAELYRVHIYKLNEAVLINGVPLSVGMFLFGFEDPGGSDLDYDDLVFAARAVPLPGAAILFGSGLLGLVGLRRRQIV